MNPKLWLIESTEDNDFAAVVAAHHKTAAVEQLGFKRVDIPPGGLNINEIDMDEMEWWNVVIVGTRML